MHSQLSRRRNVNHRDGKTVMNRSVRALLSLLFVAVISIFLAGTSWSGEKTDDPSNKPDANLTETYWKLLTMNGNSVTLGAGGKELQMVLKKSTKVNGFSGCNRFMGSFQTEGTQLQFGPLAATMMMCPEAMDQELEFLKTMALAKSHRIHEEILTIYDSEKVEILRFESVYVQ